MKITVAQVNKALKELGHEERLRRGRGYYYFADGDAAMWPESAVYVNRVSAMTIEQWIAERKRLAAL